MTADDQHTRQIFDFIDRRAERRLPCIGHRIAEIALSQAMIHMVAAQSPRELRRQSRLFGRAGGMNQHAERWTRQFQFRGHVLQSLIPIHFTPGLPLTQHRPG